MLRGLSLLSLAAAVLILGAEVPKPHAQQQEQFGRGEFQQEVKDLPSRPAILARAAPSQVIFGYHPYWSGTAWQDYNYNLLTHLAWFGISMTSTGAIASNQNGWPVTSLISYVQSQGVKVILTVTLFDDADIATLLASPTYRQNAIDNLIAKVLEGNADGVNIDFEFVKAASRDNFKTFIHDLRQAFHDQIPGSEVSIAMPSVDWWGSYDYDYLSDNSDGLMIMAYGYYWSGSANAGPLSPLNSGFASWYIKRTVEEYLAQTGNDPSQLILGLPWYGYDWEVTSTAMGAGVATGTSGSAVVYSTAEAQAANLNKQYSEAAPSAWFNYTSGGLHQVWYDDSLSLVTKYAYAKQMNLKGIGIWALGYDGAEPEIWGGLAEMFNPNVAPFLSDFFYVQDVGDQILVSCARSEGTEFYDIYTSLDGQSFSLTGSSADSLVLIDNSSLDEIIYIKIRNRNSYGSSPFSEVLAVGSGTKQTKVLVVQGFDRIAGTVNTHDFVREHGQALTATGYGFDAASNEAIEQGAIDLSDYDIVDWISGEEGSTNTSFSNAEQTEIKDFLINGGRLFVSGSEIGWDLVANGNTADIAFYHDYLKADYVVDDAGSYSVIAALDGIFSSLISFSFDDGTHENYNVDYPDGIKPYGGSSLNLSYSGVNYAEKGGAGIEYSGLFGSGVRSGAVVHLGFGFETIYPQSIRDEVMASVMNFLDDSLYLEKDTLIFASQAYPNPFRNAFSLDIESPDSRTVTVQIFNIRGQQLMSFERTLSMGSNKLNFEDFPASAMYSGVYFVYIKNLNQKLVKRVIRLR